MSQNTYMRSNHRVQVKNVAENQNLWSWTTSPANAKSQLEIHFGHKTLSVDRFSKFLQVLLRQIEI